MKKIKLLTSLVGVTGLSIGLVPMISGCSCSNSNVELDESVTKQKISIKSENIVKGQESTIEFNLPTGKTISKITLKIGDTEVTEANVTIKGNKVTIPASKMTAEKVIVKKITLAPEAQPVDFLTCDWSGINTWCTKLENGEINVAAFCAHFLNGTTPITSMDDFVGLKRTIQINNKDHFIRVIGTQHDTIVEDGQVTSKKAALTFELVTLLSDNNGNKMTSKWDTTNNYDYTNSVLRKNLNGKGSATGEDVWSTSALDMLPTDIKEAIKEVKKEVTTTIKNLSANGITNYNDKLFPLTYTEMAQSGSPYANVEGTAYKYWKDNASGGDRQKMDANKSGYLYWLSSPYTQNNTCAWRVGTVGTIGDRNVTSTGGVSFGFCI